MWGDICLRGRRYHKGTEDTKVTKEGGREITRGETENHGGRHGEKTGRGENAELRRGRRGAEREECRM